MIIFSGVLLGLVFLIGIYDIHLGIMALGFLLVFMTFLYALWGSGALLGIWTGRDGRMKLMGTIFWTSALALFMYVIFHVNIP